MLTCALMRALLDSISPVIFFQQISTTDHQSTPLLKFKLNLKYISYSIGNKSTCRFSVIFCQNTLPPPTTALLIPVKELEKRLEEKLPQVRWETMKNEVVGMYLLKSGQLLRYNYIFLCLNKESLAMKLEFLNKGLTQVKQKYEELKSMCAAKDELITRLENEMRELSVFVEKTIKVF